MQVEMRLDARADDIRDLGIATRLCFFARDTLSKAGTDTVIVFRDCTLLKLP